MSELHLNTAPSPELLTAAAVAGTRQAPATSDRSRTGPAATGSPADPFATLLAGVLGGTQPAADSSAATLPGSGLVELPEPAAGSSLPVTLTGLPGIATLPPSAAGDATGSAGNGNPLPTAGRILPDAGAALVYTAGAAPAAHLPDAATGLAPAANPGATPPEASRPRTFLADLALSRPLDPGNALPPAGPVTDGPNRQAAYLARFIAQGGKQPDAAARPSAIPGLQVSLPATGSELIPDLAATDAAPGTGMPAPGSALAAGQLAAFATGSDRSGTAFNTATADVSGIAAATPDAGSSAFLSRLGSTTLPPLQPLGNPGAFAGGLADRLLTLGGPGAHSARLKLHPEHLGALDVEISMDNGTAQVWFGTTTSQAREAIEGSLPRLRELFAEQGMELTRTQIDAGTGQGGQRGSDQHQPAAPGSGLWNALSAGNSPGSGSVLREPGAAAATTPARLLDVWA